MPNLAAYAALFAWPLVTVWLFTAMAPARAATISVVASFLLLPSSTSVDLPAIPPLDKATIPTIAVLTCMLVCVKGRARLLPRSPVALVCLVLLIGGPFVTALLNTDAVLIGPWVLPGLSPYDALSSAAQALLATMPLLVGWALLSTAHDHAFILKVLMVAGLVYALPMLIEVRLSPQLHIWIYGFFPHSFGQQVRFGGFRPVVFLNHGLTVAFFTMTAAVAAAVVWRLAIAERRTPYLLATFALLAMLVLCKSLGSLLFGLFLLPLVMVAGARLQLRIAVMLVCIATLYPVLRGADLVPVETMLETAASVSEERAQSLGTRLHHEDALLAKADERPLFGWGSWGRNRIYDEETGQDLSITDGQWVIVFGQYGWVGFLGFFGLLAWPVIAVWRASRDPPSFATTGLCLLLAINMIELLPNSTLMPSAWLIAGALLGHAERLRYGSGDMAVSTEDPSPVVPERPRTVL